MAIETDLATSSTLTTRSVTRVRPLVADALFLAHLESATRMRCWGGPLPRRANCTGRPALMYGKATSITVAATGLMAAFNGSYRVLEPRRVNDGAESTCYLQKISP